MKKGYTLVELLGVLVILALIISLVTPSIIDFFKKSSEEIDKQTLKLIYNASDLFISEHADSFSKTNGSEFEISFKDLETSNLLPSSIKATNGKKNISEEKCIQVTYLDDKYQYKLKDNGTCQRKYANGEVVYYDVTIGKSCETYTKSQSNTGVKTGCMKFYAFNDDGGDRVNLILDHNTTATIAWDSRQTNKNGPNEVIIQLKSDTDNWVGTITPTDYTMDQSEATSGANYTVNYSEYKARLITAQEIGEITHKKLWDETSGIATWHYFHDLSQSEETGSGNVCASIGCKYGWLYDRTNTSCTTYGCLNNSDLETYGYWTVSSSADNSDHAWYVHNSGYVGAFHAVDYYGGFGVRPVITIPKSRINK